MMRVDALLKRWIEVLADVVFICREAWRARRSLLVAHEEGKLTIRRADPVSDGNRASAQRQGRVLASIAPGKKLPVRMRRAVRNAFVIFELPAEEIVRRSITVPAQAQQFVAGIVGNQIERLSPWQAEQAVYGFVAEAGENPGALDVRVLISSRAVVERVRAELAAMGLAVDRIVANEATAAGSQRVALWSGLANAARENAGRTRWRIGAGVAAGLGLSVAFSLWAVASATSLQRESEAVHSRIQALQRQVQASGTPQSLASLDPPQRAWVSKQILPSAVILIEALSRALPDTAHLTELRLEKETLRISGLASDAPSLVAPLEKSGHLTNVRFFAPTTLGPDGRLSRFHIEARVQPRSKVEE
jgi:general secretion pathway protein L